MAEYDFKILSDYEFEVLTRDLLQKEFGVTLEFFTSGRDQGIDARYSRDEKDSWIIQCKHYAKSSFSVLKSRLKKDEKPKVSALAPKRYIFVTSQPLTPTKKNDILEIFSPFCQTTQDIFGKDDLNNLLGNSAGFTLLDRTPLFKQFI